MRRGTEGSDHDGRESLSQVSLRIGFRSGLAAFATSVLVLSSLLAIEVAFSDAGLRWFGGREGVKILTALVGGNVYAVHLGAYDVAQVETLLSIYGTIPDPAFLPVVVTILWGFGYRTVASSDSRLSLLAGAVQGGSIAAGYAAGTVASLAVVAVLLGPDATLFTSEAVTIVGVAGVGYPVVCGAGGGIAATLWPSETTPE